MKATILDTVTGETRTVEGPRSWEWAENNWSCDCNRKPWDAGDADVCAGAVRFLVIAAEMNAPEDCEYTLDELNQDYPAELRSRFLRQHREHPEILRMDAEAQMTLAMRRKFLRPHKHGWWRNSPNPYAVGNQINDDDL